MKLYYLVSEVNGDLEIRPLNSEEEVKQAIKQSTIIAKHVQDHVMSCFILERQVNISNFYTWLSKASHYVDLALEKPDYIESEDLP